MDEVERERERERLTDVAGILQRQEQIARLQGIQREVSALRQAQADANNKPQCPVCGGRLDGEFRKCQHCATDLIWLDGVPGEPEKEDELRAKVSERMRVENERRQLAEAQLASLPRCKWCGSPFVIEYREIWCGRIEFKGGSQSGINSLCRTCEDFLLNNPLLLGPIAIFLLAVIFLFISANR